MPFVWILGVMGEDSADRPRMMPSSTSRFLASALALRLTSSECWDSSAPNVVRFVSRSFSSPSTSARRALILSDTAPSALARDLRRALRRAACTGGVGIVLLGSVSLSYSLFAVAARPVVEATALETAIWRGTRGWISKGAAGPEELENSEPPSSGFLPEERDLSSSSIRASIASWIGGSKICRWRHTSMTRRIFC